jgi:nicotinamide mononucleotide adenylyltransferase
MKYDVIFTIGRMNPPTLGHMYLIENLLKKGLENGVKKVYIILSSKEDNVRNPLRPEEKIYILRTYIIPRAKIEMMDKLSTQEAKQIKDMKIEILLANKFNKYQSHNVFGAIHYLNSITKNKGLFVTGSPEFPMISTVDRVVLDRKKKPISGTLVRTIAHISYSKFCEFYKGMCKTDIDMIYESIKKLEKPTEGEIKVAKIFITSIFNYTNE